MAYALLLRSQPGCNPVVYDVMIEVVAVEMKEVEMESSSFVIEANLDEQTLEELKTLREIRLGLVKKQLAEADATIEELIRRELIPPDEKSEYLEELRQELMLKIDRLSQRTEISSNMIHFDELELYVDLLSLPAQS